MSVYIFSKNSMFSIKNLLVITLVLCLAAAGGGYSEVPVSSGSSEIWGIFYVNQASGITITQEISVQI